MRSVRLDSDLERQLERAAAVRGESASEFIRRAVAERAEQTFEGAGRERFADVIGSIHSKGGRARQTGEAFAETLRRLR